MATYNRARATRIETAIETAIARGNQVPWRAAASCIFTGESEAWISEVLLTSPLGDISIPLSASITWAPEQIARIIINEPGYQRWAEQQNQAIAALIERQGKIKEPGAVKTWAILPSKEDPLRGLSFKKAKVAPEPTYPIRRRLIRNDL